MEGNVQQLELSGISASGTLRHALSHLVRSALECAMPTREMHARYARYLVAYFGDRQLRDIAYPHIRAYLDDETRRGVSRETVRKRLSTLHMAMCEALRQGWIEKVPPWPVIKTDSRPKEAFWTVGQWETADAECDDEDLRTWIACGFWTGMHTSDLNRFRWSDVDLVRGTWIRRCTKSRAQPAELPLPKTLLERLRERYNDRQPHPRDLISARNMGHPNRPMKALCHRAGVPLIGPIGLRHSCETYLEERGTTELFQMTWLGHKSTRMLKKHYRHMTPDILAAGIRALEGAA